MSAYTQDEQDENTECCVCDAKLRFARGFYLGTGRFFQLQNSQVISAS
jgi:hypothetical protein